MARDWKSIALADIIEIISGGTPKTTVSEYWGGDIPWLSVSDFNTGYRWVSTAEKTITRRGLSECATTVLNKGDIIISARGTVGVVAQLSRPMAFNQSCYGIRGRQGIAETDFIYYALRRAVSGMKQVAHGGVFDTITRDTFKIINVKLPTLMEQKIITSILGALDDKIELNRRMNKTLEAMAHAIFKSWFIDFDPVIDNALAAGNPIPAQFACRAARRKALGDRRKTLPPDIAALFPDSFEDSELGPIPKGWNATTLKDGIEIFDSMRIPLNKRQRAERQGPYPYYGAAGIMDNVDDFLFDGVFVLTGEDGSVTDDDGYPVVQYVWGQFWVNNHAHILKGKNRISEEHLYLFLKQTNIAAFVTGAVQPKLSQKNLKSLPFVLPKEPVCRAFSELIQPLFAKVRTNADETLTLVSLRDTLLPKLLSGELRVPNTELSLGGM